MRFNFMCFGFNGMKLFFNYKRLIFLFLYYLLILSRDFFCFFLIFLFFLCTTVALAWSLETYLKI